MSERKLQIRVILGMLAVVICASLYAWGGMEMKWLRRFLAPSICAVFLAVLNKDPLQLLKAPLLGLSSSIGYGANETYIKVLKRLSVGLAFSVGATITDIIKAIRGEGKKWLIVGLSTVFITSAYIVLGVFNPVSARVEESLLGFIVYGMAIIPSIKE